MDFGNEYLLDLGLYDPRFRDFVLLSTLLSMLLLIVAKYSSPWSGFGETLTVSLSSLRKKQIFTKSNIDLCTAIMKGVPAKSRPRKCRERVKYTPNRYNALPYLPAQTPSIIIAGHTEINSRPLNFAFLS